MNNGPLQHVNRIKLSDSQKMQVHVFDPVYYRYYFFSSMNKIKVFESGLVLWWGAKAVSY